MISRENVLFTIGFQGNAAIVDGELKRKYGSLSAVQLAEKGFFKQALISCLYSGEEDEILKIRELYNKNTRKKIQSTEDFKKTLGVTKLPEGIVSVIIV
ncbi:MAG: hypothetical protein JW969_14720 [Spirochaetales bacterium]|nr:hypothetical protein [Spirochaetales bacterium]